MARSFLAACAVVAVLAGCSTADPPARERLGDLGEELVPAGAELVETQEGSCPQIAGNPSCARVYYTAKGTEDERADALEESARAAGWEVVSREPRADGTLVELGREGYRAFAAVWEDGRAASCREQPDPACAEELQVIEDV
ncbi:MAG: hypothetical protein ACRDNG_13400 [Gaiellaceae bacterium]